MRDVITNDSYKWRFYVVYLARNDTGKKKRNPFLNKTLQVLTFYKNVTHHT